MGRLLGFWLGILFLLTGVSTTLWLSWRFYTPDLTEISAQSHALFGKFENNSEFKEKAAFLHVLFSLLGWLPGALWISRHLNPSPPQWLRSWMFSVASVLCVLAAWYGLVPKQTYDFYFSTSFFWNREWFFIFVVAPLGWVGLWNSAPIARKTMNVLGVFASGVAILLPLSSQIWTAHTDSSIQHTGALLFPIVQVSRGYDYFIDAWTTYGGGFAYLLSPVFSSIIRPTVFNYSLVLTALAGLSFLLLAIAWLRAIRSPSIAGFAFTASLIFTYIHGKIATIEPYYQVPPLRTLFPAFFFLLSGEYARNPGSRIVRSVTTAFCVLGFFWTPDAGLWVTATWAAALLFDFWGRRIGLKAAVVELAWQLATLFAALVLIFGFFAMRFWIRQGQLPHFSLFFFNILAFGKFGNMGLPMVFPHLWGLFVIIYLAGLFWALLRARSGGHDPLVVFINALFGILTLSYFLARSHDWNLIHFSWPVFFIVGLFAERSVALLKYPDPKVGLAVLPFLLASSLPLIQAPLTLATQAPTLLKMARDRFVSLSYRNPEMTEVIDFLKTHTAPGEPIMLFSLFQQAQFLSETDAVSAFAPSILELISIPDRARLTDLLAKRSGLKVFSTEPHYVAEWLTEFEELAASPNRKVTLHQRRQSNGVSQ